jgi:hypothetical protein
VISKADEFNFGKLSSAETRIKELKPSNACWFTTFIFAENFE